MNANLNEIVTHWDELFSANAQDHSEQAEAQVRVLQRYFNAVVNFLSSCLKDEHAAEDLAQEFALRFLRGDYRNLHPEKGRFRDFLRVILRNMAIDFFRKQKSTAADFDLREISDPAPWSPEHREEQFIDQWREELLRRAWQTFRRLGSHRGALYHDALRQIAEFGCLTSEELARKLSAIRGEPITSTTARQTLRRARQMFGDSLREEVRLSLSTELSSGDALEEELIDLRLTRYLSPFPTTRLSR